MGLALVAWALTSAAQTTRAGATDAEPPANATLPISGTATTTPGVTAPDTGRTEGGAYPRSSRIAPTLLVSAGWAAATAFVWWHRRTRRWAANGGILYRRERSSGSRASPRFRARVSSEPSTCGFGRAWKLGTWAGSSTTYAVHGWKAIRFAYRARHRSQLHHRRPARAASLRIAESGDPSQVPSW